MKYDEQLKEQFHKAGKSIVLIGFMGAGKTAVAKEMHNIIGARVVDTDAEIEKMEGNVTIAEIFAHPEKGEKYFRELERKTIKAFLESDEPVILSTGGGAFMNEETRSLILAESNPVWLQVSAETAFKRIDSDWKQYKHLRPVVHGAGSVEAGKPINSRSTQQRIIRETLTVRNPIYGLVPTQISTEANPEQVAGHALSRLYMSADPA